MRARPAAAVVGDGIIGGACTLELARRGCRATLFERGAPGGEAPSAITPFPPQRFAT
ncbi:MAG TPA: NAD(P)-binding protein [Methylomirabilota bacterium]|nr:NAD(P)-binding protein [Methylomirabilota bacterium]